MVRVSEVDHAPATSPRWFLDTDLLERHRQAIQVYEDTLSELTLDAATQALAQASFTARQCMDAMNLPEATEHLTMVNGVRTQSNLLVTHLRQLYPQVDAAMPVDIDSLLPPFILVDMEPAMPTPVPMPPA